uniref:Uncharacterized protein n=1 Tax=Haemonchus contortus TaxID=6289 RepID=W6ND24_HAECO
MEVIILEHQGALRYYDYQPFQIVWRVENVLPTENVRDFSMTVHLMRTNRSDLYFYSDTTKNDSEITRSEHDVGPDVIRAEKRDMLSRFKFIENSSIPRFQSNI